MKKLISIALSSVLCVMLCLAATAEAAPENGYDKVSDLSTALTVENGNAVLSFDCKNASFTYTSPKGYKYYSVPSGEVTGLARNMSRSAVGITVLTETGEIKRAYSYSECIAENKYKVFKGKNSVKTVYDFSEYGVTVPLEVSLNESGMLLASVNNNEITDTNGVLLDVSVLHFFGSADMSEKGYILLPDGSGAAIRFNNGKTNAGSAEYSVYGTDALQKKDYKEINVNSLKFPMFAFMREGETAESLTAYVTEGDALAKLTATVSDEQNPYNTVYFTFNYRPYALTTLLDRTSKSQNIYIASKKSVSCGRFELEFVAKSGEEARLGNTAAYVGEKLFKDKAEKKTEEYSVFFDAYMGIYKQVYTLGIPHNTNFILTTIDDLKTVADDFANSVIMLHGITDYGAISNKINGKWDLSSKIGKMSDYRELEKAAELFPYSELTRFDKQTLFCNSIFHSARAVTGKSLQEYYYNPATGLAEGQSSYLLRASKLSYFAEKYIRSLNKSNITSAAPVSLGNSPYTDNLRSDREATKNEMIKALKSFKNNNISVLLSNPDGYALAYADKILSLPTGSSAHRLLDFDIPFAQMVIGKYISYSSEPINLCGDMESAVLNAAASGSSLSFAISGSGYYNIIDTDLDFLYSADYSLLREQAKSLSEEYSKRLNSTAGSYITDFAVLEDGITQTCFSNGQSVLVNRTNKEYANGETVIEAKDYILFSGGVS